MKKQFILTFLLASFCMCCFAFGVYSLSAKSFNSNTSMGYDPGNVQYTTEYYFENVDDDGYTLDSTKTSSKSETVGQNVRAETLSFDGFVFDENNSLNVKAGQVKIDTHLTLKLYYKRKTTNVNFSMNNGLSFTGSEAGSYKFGQTVNLAGNVTDGTFVNWSTDGSGTLSDAENISTTYIITKEDCDKTINFVGNMKYLQTVLCGENGTITPSENFYLNYGGNTTISVNPSTNYEVDTFKINGISQALTDNSYTLTNISSTNIIAVTFKEQATVGYKVEYYLENLDGTYTLKHSENKSGYVGENVQIDEKTFEDYEENLTHSDRVISGEISEDGNLVLRRYYNLKTNLLSFNSSNGTGTMSSQTLKIGESITLPANSFAKTGYKFIGWATTENGEVVYNNESTFEMGKTAVTLFAVWEFEKIQATINFVEASIIKTYGDDKFNNTLTNTGDGVVSYASNNTAVATVDSSTGEVTIVGVGSATISATVNDTDTYTYAQKSVSYELTVKANTNGTVEVSQKVSKTYDGSEQTINASDLTVTLNGNVVTNFTLSGTLSGTNAESYSVTVTINSGNYNGSSKVGTWKINKASGSISYATQLMMKQYEDASFINPLTNTGDGTVTFTSSDTDILSVNSTTGEVSILGCYPMPDCVFTPIIITATVVDGTNYTYTTKTVTYSVYSVPKPLSAPTVSISTEGVVSWTSVANASGYEIICPGVNSIKVGQSTLSYNLKTQILNAVSGTSGTVTISVSPIAKNTNYTSGNGNDAYGNEYDSTGKATVNLSKVTVNKDSGVQSINYVGGSDKGIYITGSSATLTANIKNGYKFAGWTGDKIENVTTITFDITKNIELSATTTMVDYTISYNLDDGVVDGENIATYNVETDSFTLKNPTKENYNFVGWTGTGLTEATLSVTIDKGSTGNREYTANWELKPYVVTLNTSVSVTSLTLTQTDGWTRDGSTNKYYKYANAGEELSLIHISRENYSFDGWYTSSTGGTKVDNEYIVSGNITLYARYTSISNPLKIVIHSYSSKATDENMSGGTIDTTEQNKYGDTYTLIINMSQSFTIPTIKQTKFNNPGYTYTYYVAVGSGGIMRNYKIGAGDLVGDVTVYNGAILADIANTCDNVVELYPIWQESQDITITLSSKNGGIQSLEGWEGSSSQVTKTIKQDEKIGTLPTVTVEGYEFVGWFTEEVEGTKVTENSVFAENVTLYPHFTKDITITLDAGAGATIAENENWTGSGRYVTKVVKIGEKFGTLPDDGDGTMIRSDYYFMGWGYGTETIGENNVVTFEEDVTLTAKWDNEIWISYKVYNDETGTYETYVSSETTYIGRRISLPAAPTRDGYTFLGWYDSKTGGNKIEDGSKVPYFSSFNIYTLYAQWEQIGYKVTLSKTSYDGTVSGEFDSIPSDWTTSVDTLSISKIYSEGATLGELPTVTCLDSTMTFVGWYTASGTKVVSSTVISGNVIYYAKFGPVVTLDGNGGYWDGRALWNWDDNGPTGYYSVNRYEQGFTDEGDSLVGDCYMTIIARTYEINEKFVEAPTPAHLGGNKKKFVGWYTSKTGGTQYIPGTTSITKSITLYARWEDKIVTISVYNKNGDLINQRSLNGKLKVGYKYITLEGIGGDYAIVIRDTKYDNGSIELHFNKEATIVTGGAMLFLEESTADIITTHFMDSCEIKIYLLIDLTNCDITYYV